MEAEELGSTATPPGTTQIKRAVMEKDERRGGGYVGKVDIAHLRDLRLAAFSMDSSVASMEVRWPRCCRMRWMLAASSSGIAARVAPCMEPGVVKKRANFSRTCFSSPHPLTFTQTLPKTQAEPPPPPP